MKSLAQVFIAMAEAGIRLQSGEDPTTSRSQQHTDAWQPTRSEPQHAGAGRGPEPVRASVAE